MIIIPRTIVHRIGNGALVASGNVFRSKSHPQPKAVLVFLRDDDRLPDLVMRPAAGVRHRLPEPVNVRFVHPVENVILLRGGQTLGGAAASYAHLARDELVRTEHLHQSPLQLDAEEPVQQRVERALEQGHGLREHHHRLGNPVLVVAVNPDESRHEVRRPARHEAGDDAEGHLDRFDLRARYSFLVDHGPPQRAAVFVRRGYHLALTPHDEHHVHVAVGHEDGRDDEDVGRHEGEVQLALPRRRVAATLAGVVDAGAGHFLVHHLNEYKQLWNGEHKGHDPRNEYHLFGT